MEGPSKKKVASGKGEKDRVPAIFKDLLEKCKVNNLEILLIPAILSQKPKPGQMWNTYLIDKESISENSCDRLDNMIKIYLAFPNYEKSGHPKKVFIKNTKTPSIFLKTLCSILPKYDHITTLKLIDCNLSKQAIEILHCGFIEMPNITDVTLDGNPISAQNHGLLASNNTIKHLSLKRCKINEIGIENLYKNLTKTEQSQLQILNLTGNYLNDIAAAGIEKILRENRSINALILADNWITDAGCYSIMSALQNFILSNMEIIKRRTITINYFRKKVKMTEEYKKEKLQIKAPIPHTPTSAKSKKSAKTKKKDLASRNILNNEMNKQVSDYVANILPKISHPFICDTTNFDGNLVCSGNLILGFLNLSYNKLTIKGYKYIIEVLNYQQTKEPITAGLSYVVLNGNLDLQSFEFDEIYKLINEKLWKIEANRSKPSTDIETLFLSSANNST